MSERIRARGTSTIPDPDPEGNRWDRRIRRLALFVVSAIVVSAAFGLLGVRTATAVATADQYRMEVLFARVTRAGLATPFAVEFSSVDGSALPGRVTIAVDATYLMMFDDNGMDPIPSESFNDDTTTWMVFEVPEGETTLRVELDARLEPAVQWGETATATVWFEDRQVVSAEFTTWVIP